MNSLKKFAQIKVNLGKTWRVSLQILTLISLINIGVVIWHPELLIKTYQSISILRGLSLSAQYEKVDIIFKDIIKAVPMELRSQLKLIIVESDISNAYAEANGTVTIYTQLIKETNNDDGQIAAILGHEIAHIILKHHYESALGDVEKEYYADLMGLTLAFKAGHNGCNVVSFWMNRSEKYGDVVETSSHPTNTSRALYINEICKHMVWTK